MYKVLKVIFLYLMMLMLVACNQGGSISEEVNHNENPKLKEGQRLEPPKFYISYKGKSYEPVQGVTSWYYEYENGEAGGIERDSGTPDVLVKDQKRMINVKPSTYLNLEFEVEPESYEVRTSYSQGEVYYAFQIDIEGGKNIEAIDTSKDVNLSEVQDYFSKEITSIKRVKKDTFELATDGGEPFLYNPITGYVTKIGACEKRYNGFRKVVFPLIRDNYYFTGYEGGRYVKYSEEDGYTYYSSYDYIDETNKEFLFKSDQYVDLYNRVRHYAGLEEVLNVVEEDKVEKLDYNDKLIAYHEKESNHLVLINRDNTDEAVFEEYTSFFRVCGDKLIYQKSFETSGLYQYENGVETKLLDFMVLDAIIYKDELYYIDTDLHLYHFSNGKPVKLSTSNVTEHVFSDDYMLVCLQEDMMHVLYQVKNAKLEFIRILTLETYALFDWYFSDGEEFYYNGSYEVPFTHSTKLEIGQLSGEVIYEDDKIIISNFDHIAYEFNGSTLMIYFKENNTYEEINNDARVRNWRIIDNELYLITNLGFMEGNAVFKVNLDTYEVELVKEFSDESDRQYFIIDYSIFHDILVTQHTLVDANESITNIDKSKVYVDEYVRFIRIGDDYCYYVVDNSELYYFDYNSLESIYQDTLDSKYAFSHNIDKKEKHFIYQGAENKLKVLNYETMEVTNIFDKCKKLFMNYFDSHYYFLDLNNNLYVVMNNKAVKISDSPVCLDDFSYLNVSRVENMFYYIDLLENKVKVYDSQSGQITVMNLFWVEGEITSLYPATVNDEPVFYVVAGSRYLITPENMIE